MATDAWAGLIHSTAPKYVKGAADLTMRGRLLLSMILNRGRVKHNEGGNTCTWAVQFDQPPVSDHIDGEVINYARHDLLRHLTIDWRGYKATDLMTRIEKEKNKGDVAIVNRYKRILPQLTQSLRDHFCAELFIDGYAAGNENKIHGIESFLGDDGGTLGTEKVAAPSDTYGGKNTAVADEGGSWSADGTAPNAGLATDWPNGSGDARYDYLSPKLMNYGFDWDGSGADTWEANCIRVLRQTHTWLRLTGGADGVPDLALLSGDLMVGLKNAYEADFRINVPHKESETLGFPNSLNFEGMSVDQDFDVPAGLGYVMNIDHLELATLTEDLWYSFGPEHDPRVDAWLFFVGFMGNMRWQPKFFAKLKSYAT